MIVDTTVVVNPATSFSFKTSVTRNVVDRQTLNVNFISGPSYFNFMQLSTALVTSVITDSNGDVGTIVWDNTQSKGKLSGSISPSFSNTPFNSFLTDFTTSGYDIALSLTDTMGRTTTIQSLNSAFGLSTTYDWSATGANELTLQELLHATPTCGQNGCANLNRVTGFTAVLSPLEITARGQTVPEPTGLAILGLGILYFATKRKD